MSKNVPEIKKGIIVYKGEKGKQIARREIMLANNGDIPGIMPIMVDERGERFVLNVNTECYLSFSTYLKTSLDKEAFFKIIRDVLETVKAFDKNHMNMGWLVFDMDFVFFNPVSRRLMFTFLPIQGYESGESIRDFFLKLMDIASFSKQEGTEYVQAYLSILRSGLQLSVYEMEKFVKEYYEQSEAGGERKIECPRCHAKLNGGLQKCIYCGKTIGIPMTGGTPKASKTVYLIRKITNERAYITKTPFVVGKAPECDYCISNNPAISRKHLEISNQNGTYLVRDVGSLNGTYINGTKLAAEVPYELQSGSVFMIANEEFIFTIL